MPPTTTELTAARPRTALPRSQSGVAPQHLLVTLLGDFWLDADAPLPLGALVELLGEFDVSGVNARAAVARLTRRGVLESRRSGRSAQYALAPGLADEFAVGAHGVLDFAVHEHPWDGRWTVALFALASGARDQRHTVYAGLRHLGFAPLYDGSWVSPRPVVDGVTALFDRLSVRDAVVLRADAPALPADRGPADVWDLAPARALYEGFIAAHGTAAAPGGSALSTRTRAMDDWRSIPDADPRLPAELRPADWPRDAAFDLFTTRYDGLRTAAEQEVRTIVARWAPDLAARVHALSVADLLARGEAALAATGPGPVPPQPV